MNVWKVILATLAIFTAGVFTGALVNGIGHRGGDRLHRLPFREPAAKKPALVATNREAARMTLPYLSRPPGRNQGKEFMERLDRELKLTPEQHQSIAAILEESQKRTKAIWEKISPELRAEMKSSREKMHEVFTPEQAARFEELMKPKPVKPAGRGQQQNSLPAKETAPAPAAPAAEPKP